MRYITNPVFKNVMLVLLILAMFGCSSNENETTKNTQVTISNLVGLWNSSEKNGAKTDVMYTRISSTGDIIEYDFDGDEVDKGLNCYHINSGKIIPIKNNIFTITTDMHKGQTFEVELELLDAGHALKIVFLKELVSKNRTASKDGLGAADVDTGKRQVESISSQRWTRMRNSSVLQNEPSCS